MAGSAPPNRALRFGSFELNVTTGELCKCGITLKLRPQAAKVLVLLATRPGDMVTREQLKEQIWGSGFFVDFEHGLNLCIQQIRAALDDDPDKPRYIETLPRHGYRFIARVEELVQDSGALPQTAAPSSVSVPDLHTTDEHQVRGPQGIARWRSQPWAVSGVALAALVVAVALFGLGGLRERLAGRAQHLRIESLAVLPLENLSHDPDQEYFSDGITDALITDLAQIGSLKVISRTSSMQYKRTKKSLPEVAHDLNVDGVVEGTVQRSGDRVRITAQLLFGPSDKHLWAESYDRELRNALQLEGEVAHDIAGAISASLARGPGPRSAALHSLNVEAYDDYLKGRNCARRLMRDEVLKGLGFLERSLQRDPNYAPAYAELSFAYQMLAAFHDSPPPEVLSKGKAAALKALALDENLAEAHTVLGLVYGEYEWDWAAEERELKRAVQLDPNSSFAHSMYALHLVTVGREKDSIQEINTALELDPFSPFQHGAASYVFLCARDYASALREGRRSVEIDPTFADGHLMLGSALGVKGIFAEGFQEWLRYLSLSGDAELAQELEDAAKKVSRLGDPGHKLAHIALSYYQRKAKTKYVAALTFAVAYLDLGDEDRTLEWLGKAFQERSVGLYAVAIHPSFDSLRSDPRFQDLLRRMNLPVDSASQH